MEIFKRIIGYVWAAPCTLIGLIMFLLGGPKAIGRVGDMIGCMVMNAWFLPSNIAAITFGNVVIFAHDSSLQPKIIKHESMHIQQYMKYGIIFYVIYGFQFMIEFIKYREWFKAYYCIGLEEEARKFAEEE